MSNLLTIATTPTASPVAVHRISALPVLVVFLHNRCNCRCVMCDIWRIRETKEITPGDLERQLASLRELSVQWVVFSGGEPQLNEQWSCLAQMLRSIDIRVTLLTAGLLLGSEAETIAESIDDVIVSLDGPPQVHNSIRRVKDAYERVAAGIKAVRQFRPDMPIRGRCTVQKENHRDLREVVKSAKQIGLNSISFLAADVSSTAFNHPAGWSSDRINRVKLSLEEIEELDAEVEELINKNTADLDSGFIVERPNKLRRIVAQFRAHEGMAQAVAPRCNAPWVSAVVEASGDVRPCFFHSIVGNIHDRSLAEIVNGREASEFRENLQMAANPICQRCVCSLYLPRPNEGSPTV